MLLELSDGVFVHNNLTKISLVNFYGVPGKKVHVIRHGFIGSKSFNRHQREEVRAKFNISKRDLVLFFIGAISDYKGIGILLEAVKELFITEIGENLRLIIAGRTDKGYLRYLLETYNETLKDERVTFISKYLSEEEVNDIFNVTDFGICPYTRATTPSTILDFMHRKLPIITTDDPNVLDLIKNYPAIIAKRGDSHSLASCISFAYNQRAEYTKKAKAYDSKSLLDAWRISAEITLKSYMPSASGVV
jgi:glycosyltransferase involved in cell wall biosynthesis